MIQITNIRFFQEAECLMMSNEKKKLLLQFPIFQNLDDDEYEKIEPFFFYKKAEKNTYLFKQGATLEGIYFLFFGKVKVFKTNSQGKEQLVNLYSGKDIFPHIGYYFHIRKYPANALIVQDAELFYIPTDKIEPLLLQSPIISMLFLDVMGEKVIDLHNRLEDKLLGSTMSQIIKLLIRLSEKHGVTLTNNKVLLKETFQNTELANMIGMTRETVSRTMNHLYEDEIIMKDKKGRLVIDMEKIKILLKESE